MIRGKVEVKELPQPELAHYGAPTEFHLRDGVLVDGRGRPAHLEKINQVLTRRDLGGVMAEPFVKKAKERKFYTIEAPCPVHVYCYYKNETSGEEGRCPHYVGVAFKKAGDGRIENEYEEFNVLCRHAD